MRTIIELTNWVDVFKKSRKAVPLGSPIWAYKITDNELIELQVLLSSLAKNEGIHRVINLYEGKYAEAFVLFTSTWLQRNSSGRSKWDPVLSAISASDMDHGDRASLARQGLRLWGLSVYMN